MLNFSQLPRKAGSTRLASGAAEKRGERHCCGRNANRKRRGASVIVETAMCMTLVLLPLSLGTLQFGVILSSGNQIEQVAREGARYAAVHAFDVSFNGDENTNGSLRFYLKNLVVLQRTAIPWKDLGGTPRAPYTSTNPAPANRSQVLDGFVQVVYANGVPSNGIYPATFVVGTPVAGQSVSVRVVYPMARKLFVGALSFSGKPDTVVPTLSKDYVATSTFVVE